MSSVAEKNINYAGPYIQASWVLTGVAAVALIFRYTIKAWSRWMLPRVSSPERIWGLEDLFFICAYMFDIAHMILVQQSFERGLGRHLWFLTDDERKGTFEKMFTSQPLAIIASMLSRAGMMCFLYTCFSSVDKFIRASIIACMVIQVLVNLVSSLQRHDAMPAIQVDNLKQSNRVGYFHYMWDDLPADGSIVCQSPDVQTTVGFVQGGFNSSIDFFLTALSAVQLWRFSLRATDRMSSGRNRLFDRIRRMPRQELIRRLWQTTSLSGPLLLSGIASIVKTYLLKSIGERNDITHNIIPFILWVKMLTRPRIENYSILLASFAPMIRLLISMVSKRQGSNGYWTNSRSKASHPGLELGSQLHTQKDGSVVMSVFAGEERAIQNQGQWGMENGRRTDNDSGATTTQKKGSNGVTVRTDIMVQVSPDDSSTKRLVL